VHSARRVSTYILIVGLLVAVPSFAFAQPLPSPWINQDVGSTGAAGSASYGSGTFTVRGSGADIWDVADAFQFVYQPLSGDGQIIARVLSVQNTNTYAKAGVMLRESLTAGSRHVILDALPGGAIEFRRADLDVDGFDWGSASNPFTYGGVVHPSLPSFAAASGLEMHGIRISHSTCFETFDVPNPPPSTVPPQEMTLTAGCNAVDAGVALPNIDDVFTGAAPDLGAFERGMPPLSFGPR